MAAAPAPTFVRYVTDSDPLSLHENLYPAIGLPWPAWRTCDCGCTSAVRLLNSPRRRTVHRFVLGIPNGNYPKWWFINSLDSPKQTRNMETNLMNRRVSRCASFAPIFGPALTSRTQPEHWVRWRHSPPSGECRSPHDISRTNPAPNWPAPELFRLLSDAHPGDVLLVEQVDRLSRLNAADWDRLKVELKARQVRVVALDLPTSWAMATGKVDDFTGRMFAAINDMMLDMLAAVARKDYEDRRRRQMEGQAKAKVAGKYVGRPENKRRNAKIAAMLAAGTSYSDVQTATGCSRATVAKIAKRAKVKVAA